jgi:tetratricopeptide (TPR) repeat protein
MDTLQTPVSLNQDSDSYFLGAEALTEKNDFPGALKIYHQMMDILSDKDPRLFEVYKNMGNLYLKCGDIEAAEEKYNLANGIDSQNENLIINYGVLAIQKGQYSEAKKRFATILDLNTNSDLAWVGMGLVHRAHSDHELSRACLLRALDENPYNKLAITNYYQWCIQDGVDPGDDLLTSYIERFPEDEEILRFSQALNQ